MISSEIRKKARECLSGRWTQAVIITLVYLVIMFVIEFVAALIPVVGPIALLVISYPISYGIIATFVKFKRGEEVSYTEFLTEAFSKFGKAWAVVGNIILKLIIPVIVLVLSTIIAVIGIFGTAILGTVSALSSTSISGLGSASAVSIIALIVAIVSGVYVAIKSLYYSLSNYILKDNDNMTGKEIVERSAELMQGNRMKLFCLCLSFIGWMILAEIPAVILGSISDNSIITLIGQVGYLWLTPYMSIATVIFYEDKAGKTGAKVEENKVETEENVEE